MTPNQISFTFSYLKTKKEIAMIISKSVFKRVLSWIGTIAVIITSFPCFAQDPVTVHVLAVHYAGNIQYSYQVTNHTRARSIVSVSIGNCGEQPPDPVNPVNAQPELLIYPAGSYWQRMPDQGDSQNVTLRIGGTFSNPPGWSGGILGYDETSYFSVDWHRNVQLDPGIRPGQTFNFGVTVPLNDDPRSPYSMEDPAYLHGHFTVGFNYSKLTDEGPSSWNYTGSIVPLDTTPPTLAVSLSPNILRTTEKLVPITATITVMDDHDPAPEIKLESITANEVLGNEDIKDAQFILDDRQFMLKADRHLKAGRIYTVTYSATDGTGNKTTASATVTVPHDQSDKEREDKGKGDGKKDERKDGKSDKGDGKSSENKPVWKFW
ncbi:MAG: hypothetical protein PHQ60_02785 [Sideroxydans sp.]|nr:hypothetical protein [Sideroxydans sp.]